MIFDRASQAAASLRGATFADARAIAQLHADSWRAHYRGSLSDAYLDGPVYAERLGLWEQRLGHLREGQVVVLADVDQALTGFLCLFEDHDRNYGTLIDNLHVAPSGRRQGLGRLLLQAAADGLLHALRTRPVYLFVLEANLPARGFYAAMGGTPADHVREVMPDGSQAAALRYVWDGPTELLARARDG